MKKTFCFVFAALASASLSAFAQETAGGPANPITASEKGIYGYIAAEVIGGAEQMPEENYSFKPTPEVRTFGALVGHIADAQYGFCSEVMGEQAPVKDIEKTKTSKADLVSALKGGVDYCKKAFAGMTDAQGAQMTKMMNFNMAKLSILSLNTAHMDEHYGNMVTYLRLKGLVPVGNQQASSQPPPKK
ncbi:MAG: DinB family protein [Acidobacteriaceae bacterium]|nr:DinB family protein [Acidobacteriaceae bacterium]